MLLFRVDELQAAQEARSTVERRYLDGHPALFPDVARSWDEQVKSTGEIADVAVLLAGFDGVPPAAPPGPDALSARTAQLVADLVEVAKVEALDKCGEGRRAMGIAADWVRARLTAAPSVGSETTSP